MWNYLLSPTSSYHLIDNDSRLPDKTKKNLRLLSLLFIYVSQELLPVMFLFSDKLSCECVQPPLQGGAGVRGGDVCTAGQYGMGAGTGHMGSVQHECR